MSGAGAGPGAWQTLETADGSVTLRHPLHREPCHSSAGAWGESRARYVAACGLPERFARGEDGLSVLDVGSGLGWNLAALLAAAEARGVGVHATSLELDADVLRRAVSLGAAALAPAGPARAALAPVLVALERALGDPAAGAARCVSFGERGSLRLLLGDARRTLPALEPGERFDAVFLDAFSPAVDPALWEPGFLAEIARRMAPGSLLSTYCAATRVRAGLVAAGLSVGAGARFGAKAEGTLAAPDRDPGGLDPRRVRRIARRAAALREDRGRREGQ